MTFKWQTAKRTGPMANEPSGPAYQASQNLTNQGTSTPKKVCLLVGLSGTVLVNFPSAAKVFV